MNGLHFDTKNIIYAYLIVDISLKTTNSTIFYNFDDITAANHKPINALISSLIFYAFKLKAALVCG